MNEAITKAINDRIDYLKAKYQKTDGQERLEWKARLNEANLMLEIIAVVNNTRKE